MALRFLDSSFMLLRYRIAKWREMKCSRNVGPIASAIAHIPILATFSFSNTIDDSEKRNE